MSWVLEHSEAKHGARLVLLAIAGHADDRGENSWASVASLARQARLEERSARQCLRRLEAEGEIEDEGRSNRGTHVYRIPGMAVQTLPIGGTEENAPAASAPRKNPTRGGQSSTPTPAKSAPELSVEPSRELSLTSSPEVESLCVLLADLIQANGVKRPSITTRWRDECRRLLDRDGYTAAQVEAVIRWAQGDSFWRSNILSMPKLREKFSALLLRMREPTRRGSEHVLDRIARDLIEEVSDGGQRPGSGTRPAPLGELPRVASR